MAQPYVGEIRMFAGNFAPAGWAFCDGQLLSILENETLFNLIGTTFGGDGQETFAVPDLRSRVPIHYGSGYILGETGGVEEVTLTVAQTPSHTHPLLGSRATALDPNPSGAALASSRILRSYSTQAPTSAMAVGAITGAGGSQPHTNIQPVLCVHFIISLFGIFPSPT